MVFLTSLNILDTGFLTVTDRTGQLATANRVNSGSALQLKGVNFDITSSASVDKAVTPGYVPTSIKTEEKRATISINPTMINISIFLNNQNIDTTNPYGVNDMSLLSKLLKLPQTKGWKAIYYPVDNTATDLTTNTSRGRDKQLVKAIGATDTTEDQGDIDITLWTGTTSAASKDLTDVNYIPVRFESCAISQAPGNKIEVTLTGVITG